MSKYINTIKQGIEKGFLHEHYGKILPIGLVLDTCSNDQLFFYFTMKLGNFLSTRGDVDFTIFNMSGDKPVIWPPTGIFDINGLNNYSGNLIATSISTANAILNSNNNKYYYVYNLLELGNLTQDDVNILATKFKIITRNADYAKFLLERYGLNSIKTYVPEGNPEIFARIIENKE